MNTPLYLRKSLMDEYEPVAAFSIMITGFAICHPRIPFSGKVLKKLYEMEEEQNKRKIEDFMIGWRFSKDLEKYYHEYFDSKIVL